MAISLETAYKTISIIIRTDAKSYANNPPKYAKYLLDKSSARRSTHYPEREKEREREREREKKFTRHHPRSSISSKYFFTNRGIRSDDTLATKEHAIPDDSRDDNEPRRHVPINQSRCRSGGLTGRRKRVSTKEGILSRRGETLTGAARREIKTKTREKEKKKRAAAR